MTKKRSRKAENTNPSEEAQFVFVGTVLQRGAATLDELPLTRDTLIVHVDYILDSPPVLAGFIDKDITVQLGHGQTVATGKSFVFYTTGWIFGASLAVRCIKLVPASEKAIQQNRDALETAPERALRALAEQAEIVVTGRVTEIVEVPRPEGAPITEHDPEWCRAIISVDDVLWGARKSGTRKPRKVAILFPASPDVRWASAPKFAVRDSGVWFLGEKKPREDTVAVRVAAGAAKDEYIIISPNDFLPAEFIERVKAILSHRGRDDE